MQLKKQRERRDSLDWSFDEQAVRREMSVMLGAGVLQMGFEQKCPRCGSFSWFLIDDVSQHLICDGCRYGFPMPAEPSISYRLSSLVRQGVFTHGIVPVVLVLGQLLDDSQARACL